MTKSSRAILLDPFSGISGDMFLAALVDVGVPFDELRSSLLAIPELSKVMARCEEIRRGVFAAKRVVVECPSEEAHRSLSTIRQIIEAASLKDNVKAGAVATFTRLAEAEAKVHGHEIEKVHFHEVGALDAIFDIVGAHVALDLLGQPDVLTRPAVFGSGTASSEHGEIPLPPPATLELLRGYPTRFSERSGELVTPTGAAIIASTSRPLEGEEVVRPERIGYGAGRRESEGVPNVLRVVLGSMVAQVERVCILTSTIDDMNPEIYGFLMEKLFMRGALEVYYNSVMMKKNRPGIEVTVIAEENEAHRLADLLMSATTTLGIRLHREERIELARRKASVDTPFGPIAVKVATRPGGGESMSPEYESCKAAAEEHGVGLVEVYDAARDAWSRKKRAER